ncbi:MAG: DUF4255 domain-containing protein [Bacteroides sp.]|nr:DUF4255 domain-containing protein [Bacteroides sp.]
MINEVLTTLSDSLSVFLKQNLQSGEELVCVYPFTGSSSRSSQERVYLTLVHVEKESTGGSGSIRRQVTDHHFQTMASPWLLNLYLLISVVFSEKQYEESLHLLSGIASFLQAHTVITLPYTHHTVSVEPVNLSWGELSNIWSMHGGHYYPSILCKVRLLPVDAGEIQKVVRSITSKEITG